MHKHMHTWLSHVCTSIDHTALAHAHAHARTRTRTRTRTSSSTSTCTLLFCSVPGDGDGDLCCDGDGSRDVRPRSVENIDGECVRPGMVAAADGDVVCFNGVAMPRDEVLVTAKPCGVLSLLRSERGRPGTVEEMGMGASTGGCAGTDADVGRNVCVAAAVMVMAGFTSSPSYATSCSCSRSGVLDGVMMECDGVGPNTGVLLGVLLLIPIAPVVTVTSTRAAAALPCKGGNDVDVPRVSSSESSPTTTATDTTRYTCMRCVRRMFVLALVRVLIFVLRACVCSLTSCVSMFMRVFVCLCVDFARVDVYALCMCFVFVCVCVCLCLCVCVCVSVCVCVHT